METVIIAAPTRNYFTLPRLVALQCGYFADEGLDVQMLSLASTDAAAEHVLQGRAHVTTPTIEQVIHNRDQGGSLLAVAGNVNRLPFSLIAQREIQTITGLRDKVIGVSSLNTGTSAIIIDMLARNGLGEDDYVLRAVGPIETRWQMLQSGEIDAGLQGIPQSFMAIDAGFNDLGMANDAFPEFQFAGYVVEQKWAEANRDVLVRFLTAVLRALETIFQDCRLANEVAVVNCGLAPDYVDRAWKAHTSEGIFPRHGELNIPGIEALIGLINSTRGPERQVSGSARDYVDTSYLDAALAKFKTVLKRN